MLRAGARPTAGAYGLVQWHLPSEKDLCILSIFGKYEENTDILAVHTFGTNFAFNLALISDYNQ